MPKRKDAILTPEERRVQNTYINIPGSILSKQNLTSSEKILLAYVSSVTQNNKLFFASNQFIGLICSCCNSKSSQLVKKIMKLGYLKMEHFDGRIRRFSATEKLKSLRSAYQKTDASVKIKEEQTRQKSKQIIKGKVNTKNTEIDTSNISDYDEEYISDLLKIHFKEPYHLIVKHINAELLNNCKEAYSKSDWFIGRKWNSYDQRYLPGLIYKIIEGFLKDKADLTSDPISLLTEKLFKALIKFESKNYTNSIRSYFNVYDHWIAERTKGNSKMVFQSIIGKYNKSNDEDDFTRSNEDF